MIGTQKYGSILWPVILLVISLVLPFHVYAQEELPDKPDMIRVTVDHADNGVLVQWEASKDSGIKWYHIYKMISRTGQRIASVSSNVLEYKYLGGGLESLAYTVTAEDSIGNESLLEDNEHRAVTLSSRFDPCMPANIITWTAYEGWENSMSGYKIYGGRSGEEMNLLDFVHYASTTYTHKDVDIDSDYNYYIETVHISGITSLSPVDTVNSWYPLAPGNLSMDYVTVKDKNTVEIQFTADISGQVNDFRVMRRSNPQTPYTEIETIGNASQATTILEDQIQTFLSNYQYLVQAYYQPEECPSPIVISESNQGSTILLQGVLEDQITTLSWTPYETFMSGLSGYTVQRRNGNGEFYDIQSLGAGTNTWSESVHSVVNGYQPGELQYRILAVSMQDGTAEPYISSSNIVSVTVETDLLVPSAFTPGSNDMNFEFRPLIDFAPEKYFLVIYDRVGRKLFETTNPGDGWDGRFRNGEFVNEGVYVYYIQLTDYTGLFKSFTGNVSVLYP